MKINIVVVVYEKEINELFLLLESISIYFDLNSIDKIYITTQEEGDSLKNYLREDICKRFPLVNCLVEINQQSDLIGEVYGISGWFIQQALKLKTASISSQRYSLVLDCKNHFINSTSAKDYFLDGKPLYSYTSERGKFDSDSKILANNFDSAFAIFGLDYRTYIDKALGSLTPFIFDRDIVLEMISFIENAYDDSFYKLFFSRLNTAEFYLYTAYLHKTNLFYEATSERKEWVSAVIWGDNSSDLNYLNWVESMILSNQLKLFGIHKNAYGKLSFEVKEKLNNLWASKGLLNEYSRFILSRA